MKKPILKLILFCIIVFYSIGSLAAGKTESACLVEHDRCEESCDKKHKTPKKDVWGNARKESDITRWQRDKCKDRCLGLKNFCIERRNKTASSEKVNEELEYQVDQAQQAPVEDASSGYPSTPSNNNIYKWTDKNGVINITNKSNSVPLEYQEGVELKTYDEAESAHNTSSSE